MSRFLFGTWHLIEPGMYQGPGWGAWDIPAPEGGTEGGLVNNTAVIIIGARDGRERGAVGRDGARVHEGCIWTLSMVSFAQCTETSQELPYLTRIGNLTTLQTGLVLLALIFV
ncbi:hypothetical protein GGX14DRAFT_405259 [Mycena pura]|uniref:Uncharacterized protein n=1 Tax=Mycena pura TaxID=153505 RepID=A0AAD6USP2_9AGAR|nr:hypothetical protein GGX14DRAFT_405259 [Mycena pura]